MIAQVGAAEGTPKKIYNVLINNLNWVILLSMIITGTLLSEHFLTIPNLTNVLRQVSVNGVLATGFTIVILADGFDLSIGTIIAICSVITVGVLNSTGSTLLAILSSLCIGLSFGLLNGFLIKLIKGDNSDTFLITLGTMLLAQSSAYTYSGGFNMYIDRALTDYRAIGRNMVVGVPILVLIMLGIMIVFQFTLKRTTLGRKVVLTGSNKIAVFMSGLDAHKIKIFSFAVSGLCAGIAAIMITARTGVASPSTGYGYEIDAAIAAIVGGNDSGSIHGSIVKTLTGVLILGLITNVMNIVNIGTVVQTVVKGTILLVVLYLNRRKSNK